MRQNDTTLPTEQMPRVYAEFLVQQQEHPTKDFYDWLSQFKVDGFSGLLHVDRAAQYGFPLPDRPADAVYYEEAYPYTDVQCEWWEAPDERAVLGIQQVADFVMSCDHFTWYSVPLAAVAAQRRKQRRWYRLLWHWLRQRLAHLRRKSSHESLLTLPTDGSPDSLAAADQLPLEDGMGPSAPRDFEDIPF